MNPRSFPKIEHPCPQDWTVMAGDDKRRFCEHCQLHVHNLSAMSPAEQKSLLSQRGTRQCIRYAVPDETAAVPPTVRRRRSFRSWHAALALFTALMALGPTTQASTKECTPPPSPKPQECKQTLKTDGKVLMGAIEYRPPLWQRILFFWR